MGFSVLAALAIGPGLVLVHLVWARDRYREPLRNVAWYVFLGIVCVFPAAALEGALEGPMLRGREAGLDFLPTLAWAFLGVALVEEAAKYAVLWLRARRDRHLDEPFDWIVYAVAVSLGFATIENAFYVAEGGAVVGIARAFTAVPSHALDGTMMGWRLARAHTRSGSAARRERVLALVEPALWHGAYDALLMRMSGVEGGAAAAYGFAWLALCVMQWSVCGVRLARMCRDQHVPVPPVLFPARLAERVRLGGP